MLICDNKERRRILRLYLSRNLLLENLLGNLAWDYVSGAISFDEVNSRAVIIQQRVEDMPLNEVIQQVWGRNEN